MHFIADTANIQELSKLLEVFPLLGVTTNPSIIAKEGIELETLVHSLHQTTPDLPLHIQVLSTQKKSMIQEALYYKALFDSKGYSNPLYIKVPVSKDGLAAIPIMRKAKILVTATSVITPLQGLWAAQAGANYVVPYVNRIESISGDSVATIQQLVQLIENAGLASDILAASFKNIQQILQAGLAGAQVATVSPDLLWQSLHHPLVDSSVEQFHRDGSPYYSKKF
jgi:fructose-6-phosphate aldolase 2